MRRRSSMHFPSGSQHANVCTLISAAPVRCQQGKEPTGSAGPAFAAHEILDRSAAIRQTAMDSAGASCLSSPRGMQSIAATKPKRAASTMGENADEHFEPSLECGAAAGGTGAGACAGGKPAELRPAESRRSRSRRRRRADDARPGAGRARRRRRDRHPAGLRAAAGIRPERPRSGAGARHRSAEPGEQADLRRRARPTRFRSARG